MPTLTDMLQVYATETLGVPSGGPQLAVVSEQKVIALNVVSMSNISIHCVLFVDDERGGRLILTYAQYLTLRAIIEVAVANSEGTVVNASVSDLFDSWVSAALG